MKTKTQDVNFSRCFLKMLYVMMASVIFINTSCTTSPVVQEGVEIDLPINIIPEPVDLVKGKGTYALINNTIIDAAPELQNVAEYLISKVKPATGFEFQISPNSAEAAISLMVNQTKDDEIGEEGYKLEINNQKVQISANSPAGLFYGVQTLLQLLPKEIESKTLVQGAQWILPAVSVTDYPRFGWRGLMLDVSRHFFSKEYVLDYIDQMARYKYNRFHMHLTDDNGWRVEIKSLPKLTEVGAWRVPRVGKWDSFAPPGLDEKATDGGFYTQEDIKEIVAYAKSRFIEVLPEIDVPGHSMAALAAYPHLSVTKDKNVRVNPGSRFATWHGNGTFTMHVDNTLNPTDDKVYEFLDKVFTEIALLFPFEYIHMGGDECYKGYWERDPQVRNFMRLKGIKDADELQSHFVKRVNQIINSKGKKMIGWDEILEGGLAEGAAVMSWRGTKGGVEAAHQKAKVVMSPAPMCYLDLCQGEPSAEPPVYSTARLNQSYNWDPVPDEVDPKYILGGQGNLWTEQIPNPAQIEYMTYPRAFALSEVFWSPKEKKDWNNFIPKVESHFERFDQAKINYARSMFDPIIKVSKNEEGKLVLDLTTEVEGLELYYTLDNTLPNQYYSKYESLLELPETINMFRVVTYRDGKQVGKMISIPMEDLKKRVGR
jgi:hexosaminidase